MQKKDFFQKKCCLNLKNYHCTLMDKTKNFYAQTGYLNFMISLSLDNFDIYIYIP